MFSKPKALHLDTIAVDGTKICLGTTTNEFEIGGYHGTFHWSMEQSSATDLVSRFQTCEYKLLRLGEEDESFLVVRQKADYYSRIGAAEVLDSSHNNISEIDKGRRWIRLK
jgi:hypothetical protein